MNDGGDDDDDEEEEVLGVVTLVFNDMHD